MTAWMRGLAATLAALGLAGCATEHPAVDNLTQVTANEVIVVGRIEVSPPLDDKDQVLHGIGTGRFKNKVYVATGEQWREKAGRLESGDEYFEATLGEPFYINGGEKPFYMLTGIIYTTVTSDGAMDTVNLPGGLKVNFHAGDRAVYIGTLRYTRNDYFDITKAQIIDDYARANAAFKKKFGVKYDLKKADVSVHIKK